MENRKSKFTAFLSSIIAGIIVAMVVYFGLNFAGYKEYRASAKLVTTSVENLNEENPAATFAGTLNSKAIKARTLENLKIDWPESKLDSKLSLTPISSSPIIEISVTDTNKLRAEDLADEYADLSVTVINNIYNTGANVMEYAYQNANAVDNTIKYATYAGLAGFLIYLIISLVSVSRYNHKLKKNKAKDYKKEEKKAKNQVKKNKEEIEEEEILEEDVDFEGDDDFDEKIEEESPEVLKDLEDEIEVKEETRPLEQVSEEAGEDFAATRKIDKADIDKARQIDEAKAEEVDKLDEVIEEEKGGNKLEILGKLPKYQRGALDV